MNYLLPAAFFSACALAAPPAPGTGSIEGHVLNSLTGTPVRKASVILTAPLIRLVADTDQAGLFRFTALPSGTYRLSAGRSGFLDHPARRPVPLGEDSHVTDAEIRLPPQGEIAGRVIDEDGDPVAGAFVACFRKAYRDGVKTWDPGETTFTDDTGEYRLPKLTPGRYLVKAETRRPAVDSRYTDRDSSDNPKMVYVPAYYPNAASQQAASPVEVGVGAEVHGIDIHLLKLARFHVRGKVTGVPPNAQPTVLLFSYPDVAFPTDAAPPDYAFDVTAPPGQYAVFADVGSGGLHAHAEGAVTVTGDVADVVLTMSPPVDVTGRISLAESGSQVNLPGVAVTMIHFQSRFAEVRSDAGGKLTFDKPFPPGHYAMDVDVRSLPDGCFVRNVKLGEREVSADDFEIQASTQLEIVLSNTAGRITGSVTGDDGKPFPNAAVTLIPTDGKSRPTKQSANGDGSFRFTALRPGTYQLFAWEEVDDAVWQDPDYRRPYQNRVAEITVGPGETQNAQLQLIAAADMK